MRIAVDVSPLSHPPTGIGNYIRGSLAGLAQAAGSEHEIVAFAPTSLRGPARIRQALAGIPVATRLWRVPASHAVRTGWSILGRPSAERLLGPFDALLYTDWMTPPQSSGLRATTIHDLNPLHHPEWCTPRTIAMHRRKDADAVRACDVVFTNSRFTADDATASLGIEAERLVVAHPGVGTGFRPDGERTAFDRPFVLGVGTLEPRKNLQRLVEAWRLLGGDHRLVLAGGSGWGEQPGLDDDGIVLAGYVRDEALPALYRGADVYVYPSLFEGFGIPVVEAMACGTPVVVSNHPSLDEACGSAAVRVDPQDPESIAAGITEALTRRDELVPAGVEHAAQFTWRATGETMLDALVGRSRT
jgi:glycosyltransferase involved in cell wall biosynthesis